MVSVVFSRDSRQRLSSIFATGHAGWAQEGGDVVCAAVSAILQAARLGLEEHARVAVQVEQRKGDLCIRVPEDRREDAAVTAILSTAELSVAQIASQFPTHVRCEARTQT
ncbi:MAG: ribosomal-processing cysteine protease Prp [Vulcanimicrobiaceae bacterium]